MKSIRKVTSGATVRGSHRVTFAHDLESLQDPLPTMRVVFNIHLSPSALMTDSEIEKPPKPQRKPLRRLFGSLVDFCASMENPECRQCDNCDCTYDSEHNWKHTPQHADIEWICENCTDCEQEEKVPENVECPNCWCETTQRELDSDGCFECGLGTDTDDQGLGIACDFCERSYSDECDWVNGNRILVEHDISHDYLWVCPHCQKDEDFLERLDAEAEKYAEEYFRERHPKKFNHVLDQILESQGMILSSACGMPLSTVLKIQLQSLKYGGRGRRSGMVHTNAKIERLSKRLANLKQSDTIFMA